jgi:hypothetical protein
MACAARGSLLSVSWQSGRRPDPRAAQPLFGANDNGDADYRAVTAAAQRLWRGHGQAAPAVAAQRAQAAFWQGRMASCRWWHSVARMLDRALVAGLAAVATRAAPERAAALRTGPQQ